MAKQLNVHRIRQRNVRRIIGDEKYVDFAERVGVPVTTVSRWFMDPSDEGHQNIGEKNARKLEGALGLQDYELDREPTPDKPLKIVPARTSWPFDDLLEEFMRLEPGQRSDIAKTVRTLIAGYRSENTPRQKKLAEA